MILVTGAAGLIGSSLIKELNKRGIFDIIGVDNLKNGKKIKNLSDIFLVDYYDKSLFLQKIKSNALKEYRFEAIFHLGACSDTTEWDGAYLMQNNFEYSKSLFNWSRELDVPFIYASSASVYGLGNNGFEEKLECEKPLNAYAFSKFQFDNYIRSNTNSGSQVVGLRYFNVFGHREAHKGRMASVIHHFRQQILEYNEIRLFKGTNGVLDGEQKRDFVYVDDCIKLNLWAAFENKSSGIYNVGTGRSRTYNELAKIMLEYYGLSHTQIKYIDFPESLSGSYQNFTQADLRNLEAVGFKLDFMPLEIGIPKYLAEWEDA